MLNGGGGNDTLTGGTAGADTMAGGAGNDTYFVDNAGDVVNETAGQGTDTVSASVNYSLTAGSEIEFLRGTGTSGLSLNGNELANTVAGTSGNDTLDGGLGNDTLNGGTGGNDFFKFLAGFGQDTISRLRLRPGRGPGSDGYQRSWHHGCDVRRQCHGSKRRRRQHVGHDRRQLDPTPRRRPGKHHSVRLHSRLKSG